MAAKRSDCVLVIDEEDHLSGIFTAKDLAYRVVASHMDARATTVSDIMTRNPMCVTADTSAQDALNLMVSRGFRHLPVCNEEGDIFGLLDITKCLYEALNKMERAYGSSRKLYDALEGVEREWANSPVQFVQYMDALRDKMSCPDLTTVLDNSMPVQVAMKANVRDVATLMKEHHTTAVLVMDHGGLSGIFTSKDIVLRVIAAGLAPENCSVVRVMTPHPDTASPSTSILDALKKMHDGHYLNLPVINDDQHIVGLVDVLRLTYATLDQINSIEGHGSENGGKFWHSMMAGDNTETESAISDSLSQAANSHMFPSPASPHPDRTLSPHSHHHSPYSHTGYPEITPGDSASMANGDDMRSTVSSHVQGTFSFKFTYGNKTHRFRCEDSNYMALRDIVRQKIMADHLTLSQSYVKVGDETHNNDDDRDDSWLSISYLDDEDDKVLLASDADMEDAVHLARKLGQDRVRLFVQDSMAPQQANNDTQSSQSLMTTQPNPDDIHVPAGQPTISVAPPPPPTTTTTPLDPPDVTRDENNNRSVGKKHRHMRRRQQVDSDVTSSSDISDRSESDSDMSDYDSDVRYSSGSGSRRRRYKRQQRRAKQKRDGAAQFDLPIPQEMLLPAAITFLGVVILGVFTITKFTAHTVDRRF
ncbi:CBS-domain-containing protein [Lichtheimia hyalospora FSU 10163]|nr:CBS-domain-containing protein [Lichtheimia hyalospora FSU 10163]